MTTQPTTNQVPSESPRDLKFNAGKIDEFVTSLALKYADRLGNEHYTIEGLRHLAQQAIAEFGWIPVGTFQAGAMLTLPNQILKNETDGEYYRWDGDYPKDVPAGSTPESPGGVGDGAWVSVGDAALRSQLKSSNGAALSLSQVATNYGLDFSLGGAWSAGATTTTSNWWLYNNKVYKAFSAGTLGAKPTFENYYILSPDGRFDSTQFGMELSTTNSEKLTKISEVLAGAGAPLHVVKDSTLLLTSDFVWSFNHIVDDGVIFTVNSESNAARNIVIKRSSVNFTNSVLGAGISVLIDCTEKILTDIIIDGVTFTNGGVTSAGNFRGKRLTVANCRFINSLDTTKSFVSFKDWSYVSVTGCRGSRPSHSFVFITPSYSYTCHSIFIENNIFTDSLLFGVAISGADEIGVVNNINILNNTIQCATTSGTRGLVLQTSSGGMIIGNNITAGIAVAADGTYEISFEKNTCTSTAEVGIRLRNCAGWILTANKYYVSATTQYHLSSASDTGLVQKGRAGRIYTGDNIYMGGLRGIGLLSGFAYSVGSETFISNVSDNTVGRVLVAASTFNSSIESKHRGTVPASNAMVTNNSTNTVLDGFATQNTGASSITQVINGTVVSALRSKVFQYTVDLNNNMNNLISACDGSNTRKPVSVWASSVSGARLAINASAFNVDTGRFQNSIVNGAPVAYTDKSGDRLTGVYAGCVVHNDGYMHCRYMPKAQLDLEDFLLPQLYDYAYNSAFFNIPLVINGVISPFGHDSSSGPRTAIGQNAAGLFVIVVVDGRTASSPDCTTVELANYMISLGCVTAFNLDGGGSTTVWFEGAVRNNPSDGAERPVPQAWVFK